ncbi:CAMP phosphodiesterases class-II:Metallo-beta-lactamase superfamily [hydrothermal vent metagenome]|uniref:cAMP phosphodiesterases class-II:Metallo-beta-lactamase superfamily n=1 Tax=hydrothermal vent metagenome TaxID=652676 RepID=A0A3B0XHT0_9ZZZZ
MKLRVLGCSGGISKGLRTSSYLIDDDILLDAGTGVGDLSLDEMRKIRHVFISHSHMDHVLSLPLLVDTLFSSLLDQPLQVHARVETIKALKQHMFNWVLWPDFTQLPDATSPVLEFIEMNPGDELMLGERRIETVNVNHTVPASAFIIETPQTSFAYSGDTCTNDSLWERLNALSSVDFMIIEVAFGEEDIDLARLAKHYCPSLLAEDLQKLRHQPKIGISHLKPGSEERIFQQCCDALEGQRRLCHLASDDHFQI